MTDISSPEQWDTHAVCNWISSIGFDQYRASFEGNEVSGDVLMQIENQNSLKDLSVNSVGHRIAIVKAIEKLKQAYAVASSLSIAHNRHSHANSTSQMNLIDSQYDVSKLEEMIRERDIIIDEVFKQITMLKHDVKSLKQRVPYDESVEQQEQQPPVTAIKTKGLPMKIGTSNSNNQSNAAQQSPSTMTKSAGLLSPGAKSLSPVSPNGTKVSPTSPTTEDFLNRNSNKDNGAIRVYGHKLHNHENESYKSILISIYDTCSKVLPLAMKKWKINDDWKKYALFMYFKGQEKCLSYDDKPLLLMQQNRDGDDVPVFILRAFRTTESSIATLDNRVSLLQSSLQKTSITDSLQNLAGETTNTSLGRRQVGDNASIGPGVNSNEYLNAPDYPTETAVAIYEYRAERDDEFDVAIGDTFVVKDKSVTGWWVVEKQVQGQMKTGWVPAGCLMASEQEEDTGSSQGTALFDYNAVGANELSIKKGDLLIVHKKYQHWLLAENQGVQGWVPSCYVSTERVESMAENTQSTRFKVNSTANQYSVDYKSTLPSQAMSLEDTMEEDFASRSEIELTVIEHNESKNLPRSNQLVNFRQYETTSSQEITRGSLQDHDDAERTTSSLHSANAWPGTSNKSFQLSENMASSFMNEEDPIMAMNEFSSILNRLKSAAIEPIVSLESSEAGLKNNKAALSKLDSLLGSFDNYQFSDSPAKPGSPATKSSKGLGRLSLMLMNKMKTGTPSGKLGDILHDISGVLADLQMEALAPDASNEPAAHPHGETAIQATKELATIAAAVSPSYDKYGNLLEKLEVILEQAREMKAEGSSESLTEPKVQPHGLENSSAEDPVGRTFKLQNAISQTYQALTEVANLLLNEAIAEEPYEENSPLTAIELGSQSNRFERSLPVEVYEKAIGLDSPSSTLRKANLKLSGNLTENQSNNEGTSISSPPARPATLYRIIPYEDLVARVHKDLDYTHLEKYLSNEDCLEHLGCTKQEVEDMPDWRLNLRKKRANLL